MENVPVSVQAFNNSLTLMELILFSQACMTVLMMASKRIRGSTIQIFALMAWIFGLLLCLRAACLCYFLGGVVWILVGFMLLGVGVYPVALGLTLFHGSWIWFVDLLICGVLLTGQKLVLLKFHPERNP